jgi:hypothetical protein
MCHTITTQRAHERSTATAVVMHESLHRDVLSCGVKPSTVAAAALELAVWHQSLDTATVRGAQHSALSYTVEYIVDTQYAVFILALVLTTHLLSDMWAYVMYMSIHASSCHYQALTRYHLHHYGYTNTCVYRKRTLHKLSARSMRCIQRCNNVILSSGSRKQIQVLSAHILQGCASTSTLAHAIAERSQTVLVAVVQVHLAQYLSIDANDHASANSMHNIRVSSFAYASNKAIS